MRTFEEEPLNVCASEIAIEKKRNSTGTINCIELQVSYFGILTQETCIVIKRLCYLDDPPLEDLVVSQVAWKLKTQ